MTDISTLKTAVKSATSAQRRGRTPKEYDTPVGIFWGLQAAAKANNISVSTFQKRLKDDPARFYDCAEA